MNADTILQVNVETIALLSGLVVPLVVGLLTKLDASSKVKAVLNVVLAVAVGALAAFTAHEGTLTIGQLITACMTAFLSSGVSYNHFWLPVGAAPAVQNVAPNFGLGKPIDTTQAEMKPVTGTADTETKYIGQEPTDTGK